MNYQARKSKSLRLLFWGIIAIAVPLLIDSTLDQIIHNPASGMAWPAFFLSFLFFPFKWMSSLAGTVSLIAAYDGWPPKPVPAGSSAASAGEPSMVKPAGNVAVSRAPISELV